MLDIRWIRSNADEVKAYLANRNNDFNIEPLLSLDEEKRKLLSETEELKAKRNEGSRKVGMAKSKGEDAGELMEEMRVIGDRIRDNPPGLGDILDADLRGDAEVGGQGSEIAHASDLLPPPAC